MKEALNKEKQKQPVLVRFPTDVYHRLLIRSAEETLRRKKPTNVQALIIEAAAAMLSK